MNAHSRDTSTHVAADRERLLRYLRAASAETDLSTAGPLAAGCDQMPPIGHHVPEAAAPRDLHVPPRMAVASDATAAGAEAGRTRQILHDVLREAVFPRLVARARQRG